jgi:hypothetical protein
MSVVGDPLELEKQKKAQLSAKSKYDKEKSKKVRRRPKPPYLQSEIKLAERIKKKKDKYPSWYTPPPTLAERKKKVLTKFVDATVNPDDPDLTPTTKDSAEARALLSDHTQKKFNLLPPKEKTSSDIKTEVLEKFIQSKLDSSVVPTADDSAKARLLMKPGNQEFFDLKEPPPPSSADVKEELRRKIINGQASVAEIETGKKYFTEAEQKRLGIWAEPDKTPSELLTDIYESKTKDSKDTPKDSLVLEYLNFLNQNKADSSEKELKDRFGLDLDSLVNVRKEEKEKKKEEAKTLNFLTYGNMKRRSKMAEKEADKKGLDGKEKMEYIRKFLRDKGYPEEKITIFERQYAKELQGQ